jgi:hypothetical protein
MAMRGTTNRFGRADVRAGRRRQRALTGLAILAAVLLALAGPAPAAPAAVAQLTAGPITPDTAGKVQEVARIGRGRTNGVMAWLPSGIAVSSKLGIYLYDPATLAQVGFQGSQTWADVVGAAWADVIAFSPDGQTVATERPDGLSLWRMADGAPVADSRLLARRTDRGGRQ